MRAVTGRPNSVEVDGIPWVRIDGQLYTDYQGASDYTGYSVATLQSDVCRGKLKRRRFGRYAVISRDELNRRGEPAAA